MSKDSPAVKLLMRLTKDQLLYKACEYQLVSARHTKLNLAVAIAKHESEEFSRCWSAISEGGGEKL